VYSFSIESRAIDPLIVKKSTVNYRFVMVKIRICGGFS